MPNARPFRIVGNLVDHQGRTYTITGLASLLDDPSPELAADLDCNDFNVDAAGVIQLKQGISPSGASGYTTLSGVKDANGFFGAATLGNKPTAATATGSAGWLRKFDGTTTIWTPYWK